MIKAVPHVCPKCPEEDSYYGRLVFPGEDTPVFCPHHKKVQLVPARP